LSQSAADAAIERVQDALQEANVRFERQRGRAATTMERISHALEFVSAETRPEDEVVARYLEETERRIRRVASYVSSASPRSMTDDVTKIARSNPAAVFGSSFLAGIMLGRFLRASQKNGASKSV